MESRDDRFAFQVVRLDEPAGFTFNNEAITNRRVFDGFIYGDAVHAEETRSTAYADYLAWSHSEVFVSVRLYHGTHVESAVALAAGAPLDVLSRSVVDTGDGWAAEGGVVAMMVVEVEPLV